MDLLRTKYYGLLCTNFDPRLRDSRPNNCRKKNNLMKLDVVRKTTAGWLSLWSLAEERLVLKIRKIELKEANRRHWGFAVKLLRNALEE
jgi:hypothetical protein